MSVDQRGVTVDERPAFRLVRTARTTSAPQLDPGQQAVVDVVRRPGHGPLVLLAGPGTGKTTTLVEAVVARVEQGSDPARVLTLTYGRKAAAELRDRLASRLGSSVATQSAWTFHAFAYALAGETRVPDDVGRRLRLLSGPEQDVVVRDLLAGDLVEGTVAWPADLHVALGTRGFADEVRQLVARARTLGLDPRGLREVAGGRPDWVAAAAFLGEYLAVLDARGLLDYAELVQRAVAYASSPVGRADLRERFDLVVVDEYQDTDPAQEQLLRAIAGDGRDLLVVGDPDQSIYAFRGADVRGILEFAERFRRSDGSYAQVLTLGVSRRAGEALLAASRAVASRLGMAGVGLREALREHRHLRPAHGLPAGTVEVLTFPSVGRQLEAVADLLRREHLTASVPWSDMAVLVRSGARSVPTVRRVLGGLGVPVAVAGDELPLAREAAAAPLLLALRVAVDPAALTTDTARTLLVSPLGGVDVGGLRALGRVLREDERAASVGPDHPLGRLPRPSAALVREALAEPEHLVALVESGSRAAHAAAAVLRLGRLLGRARELVAGGAPAYDVLWLLWTGTSWARRLERTSANGGPDGRAADRDLDVVVALFDVAAHDADLMERRGIAVFLDELEAQQIPADTLAERGVPDDGVRVLTAHRSKGLEWPVVVVVDVQEGSWPDLGRHGTLLQAERLDADGLGDVPPPAARLAEERRLFYVAVTRASRRLVVAAVESPEDDGVRPSRFLAELGVEPRAVPDRPRRPLTLPALVAELRSVAGDPTAPERLRRAAARRLATLAEARHDGRALVPAAHPDRWWGVLEPTDPGRPLYPEPAPLQLSGSSLSALEDCPLRWFLRHEVRADSARSTALGFGSVVHALAHEVGRGGGDDDLERLLGLLDSVWNQLAFDAPWRSELERAEARAALARFLVWHRSDRGRVLLATEHAFEVTFRVGGRDVVLRGSMDRVEVDAEGRVHVVDLKTSRNAPGAGEIASHPQLGAYQLAVREGAVQGRAEPGGAELVQLRDARHDEAKVQRQLPPEPDGSGQTWVDAMVRRAAARLAAESFPPTPNRWCQTCEFHPVCPARDEGRQVVV